MTFKFVKKTYKDLKLDWFNPGRGVYISSSHDFRKMHIQPNREFP